MCVCITGVFLKGIFLLDIWKYVDDYSVDNCLYLGLFAECFPHSRE